MQHYEILTAEEHRDPGDSLFRQGEYDEAVNNHTRAIKQNPKVKNGYLNRGRAFNQIF